MSFFRLVFIFENRKFLLVICRLSAVYLGAEQNLGNCFFALLLLLHFQCFSILYQYWLAIQLTVSSDQYLLGCRQIGLNKDL